MMLDEIPEIEVNWIWRDSNRVVDRLNALALNSCCNFVFDMDCLMEIHSVVILDSFKIKVVAFELNLSKNDLFRREPHFNSFSSRNSNWKGVDSNSEAYQGNKHISIQINYTKVTSCVPNYLPLGLPSKRDEHASTDDHFFRTQRKSNCLNT